jgi:murein DD-endopeptidase MepM/ murein hydrolase activator NlpD
MLLAKAQVSRCGRKKIFNKWAGDPMSSKRFYTFIVANHATARMWRLCLPYPVFIAIGVLAVIGLITVGTAGYHYGRMVLKVTDYNRLLAENDSFRAENVNYRIQTAQLGEKIDFLETTSRKLMTLSGMNSEKGVGGVGGFSRNSFRQPLPSSSRDLVTSIDTYNKKVSVLEDRYRKLEEFLADSALVESATPSIMPVKGYVTEGMGRREDPFNAAIRDFHTGVDISAPYGSRVIAPADGTVIFAGPREGYGNIVVIDHKFGVTTRYGHLYKFNVQVGQHVSRYDVVGYIGTSGRSTGPHLHFELWFNNRPVNPIKYIHARSD